MGFGNEMIAYNDPEEEETPEEEEEEEEEEEDLVDPLDTIREKCEQTEHCVHYKERLESCEARVSSRSNTTEECTEELFDFLHARDHCATAKDMSEEMNVEAVLKEKRLRRRTKKHLAYGAPDKPIADAMKRLETTFFNVVDTIKRIDLKHWVK
ncbi:hypothetical protein NHX12_004685 [Muraenolepis orangiensis]|uniref:Ubiquinol-cytochrome C reductase hinge domain-containing protein n=1 Tax=Muraenolepis orangiensis TaxID=630683 RepID=A0A9Q0DX83_9TELE|nr:hypothetical protein NHX12_004685 [Muraenolepis orangiensis]